MNQAATATTLGAKIPWRYRTAAQLVLGGLTRWHGGALRMALPDGSGREYGDRGSAPAVTVTVKDWKFFWRALTAGDIGVGESYMAGEWECSDLVEVCRGFLRDQSVLDCRSAWTLPARLWHAWLRLRHVNSLTRQPAQHRASLRLEQRPVSALPRRVDAVQLCRVRARRRLAGGGAAQQDRPDLPAPRPGARHGGPRDRQRLGRVCDPRRASTTAAG